MQEEANINILDIIYNTDYLGKAKREIKNFVFFKIINLNLFNK